MSARGEITDLLLDAGATQGALGEWWCQPHPELDHYSPSTALELFPEHAGIVEAVRRIARRDAEELLQMAAEPGPRGIGRLAHRRRLMGGPSTCESTV